MNRVVIESPYAGNVDGNLKYLRACMRDCLLNRGEAPFASHGLYTQPGVLDDNDPEERKLGIGAGFEYREPAERTAFYLDAGLSRGMKFGFDDVDKRGFAYELRAFLDGLDKPSTTIFRVERRNRVLTDEQVAEMKKISLDEGILGVLEQGLIHVAEMKEKRMNENQTPPASGLHDGPLKKSGLEDEDEKKKREQLQKALTDVPQAPASGLQDESGK